MKSFVRLGIGAATAAIFCVAAAAQTPSPAPARPVHHGLFGFLHRPKHTATQSPTSVRPIFGGKIIGNKNTHVYHMAGEPGRLPDPKNRVYFNSEREAVAAGFRRAGSPRGRKAAGHMGMHSGHMMTTH